MPVATQLADEDKINAVTMSAVSAGLGFTTMATYPYFPGKEALLDAIVDAGMGLPSRPPEPRDDWRSELAPRARISDAPSAILDSRTSRQS